MNGNAQSNGYKILIIDDDEDLSMIISDMLTDYGYRVTHVTDGNGAFDLLSDNTYHLILLDINLPDADGFSILLSTIEGAAYPVTFSDPVDRLNGVFAYYVVPAHPSLQVDGAQLCGKSSEKRWISVYHPISLSP